MCKFSFLLISIFFLAPNFAQAETLQKGSVVCWSKETLRNYITADKAMKKHMEDHACGVTQVQLRVTIIEVGDLFIETRTYPIVQIQIYYASPGNQKTDVVWTFQKNIKK